MTKAKVCFIGLDNLPVLAHEYGEHRVGGAQVQQTLLAKALVRHGYRVSMVVADHGQTDGAIWEGVETYKANRANAGLPLLRFIHPRWTALLSAVRRSAADILYLSRASVHVGQLALYARHHHPKIIFRVASDTDCVPDKLTIKYWRDRKLYEYGLRRMDAVLAQTSHQQEALRRNYGVSSRIAAPLVDGARIQLRFGERVASVLWVSNIYPLKRPELILQLARDAPGIDFHLIGGPAPGLTTLYEDIRKQAGLCDNVTFHGRVPYHEGHDFFGRARVCVSTSDIEGFPNTYLQSWIHGTPVVAFFDPDNLIAREGLGRNVRTLAEMRHAILELVTNSDLWEATSARCKAFMAREYSEDRILPPYMETIDRLASC